MTPVGSDRGKPVTSDSRASTAWLVINLDRSPKRMSHMADTLRALGLDWTRVPAVDGRLLPAFVPGIDPDLYWRTHGRELRSGEIGCYLSHLRAMAMFLKTSCTQAVVLEDDAVLTPEAVDIVSQITSSGAPEDWDMVKLEGHRQNLRLPLRRLSDRYTFSVLPTRPTGSAAYLVNRTAADTYLRKLLPMCVPYDHAFDRGWAMGLRVRAVSPFPIRTGEVFSTTIGGPSEPIRKIPLRSKAPTLLWRASTEFMRAVSAISAVMFPKRPFPSRSSAPTSTLDLAAAADAAVAPPAMRAVAS